MDRREAMLPLSHGEGRTIATAGVMVRGQLRQAAVQYGLDYYEEKSWLDSTFVFRGPVDRIRKFIVAVNEAFGEIDD